jgi:hypothetical protein
MSNKDGPWDFAPHPDPDFIKPSVNMKFGDDNQRDDMHCAESSMRHAIDCLNKGNLQEAKMQLEIAQEAIDRLQATE